jgi:hypothetical protein
MLLTGVSIFFGPLERMFCRPAKGLVLSAEPQRGCFISSTVVLT